MMKKKNVVATSERRRSASSRSRCSTLAKRCRARLAAATPGSFTEQQAARAQPAELHILVAGEHHHATAVQVFGNAISHQRDSSNIQRSQWLIQNPQRLRAAEHQSRQSDTPPLALRQRARRKLLTTPQAEALERFEPASLHRQDTVLRQAKPQVLQRGKVVLDGGSMAEIQELGAERLTLRCALLPLHSTLPVSGGSSVHRMRSRLVLPLPLGPATQINSPA